MEEQLPSYSSTLEFISVGQCRFESSYLEWKKHSSRSRRPSQHAWEPMCVEIDSTRIMLRVLKHKRDQVFVNRWFVGKSMRGKGVRDDAIESVLSKVVLSKKSIENLVDWEDVPFRTYTMQFASIGANKEETNCLRLRLGDDQFLMRCRTEVAFHAVYHALTCAAGISLPLEFREMYLQQELVGSVSGVKTLDYYEPWMPRLRWQLCEERQEKKLRNKVMT